jgi:hypothetical protein
MTTTRPTIYAPSMLAAQAVKLDADTQEWLQSRADRFRKLVGAPADELTAISIPVVDPASGVQLGQMTYMR